MSDAIDPRVSARGPATTLPKRFYVNVSADVREDLHVVLLDGRPLRTPGKRLVALPTMELAQAIAAEWAGQGVLIDPATMPLTRIANSAIQGVADDMAAVADEIVRYAGSDLICYRAGAPQSLCAAQALAWDPVVDWARESLGARFVLTEGITFVAQPAEAIAAFRNAVLGWVDDGPSAPFRLAAMSVMVTLTGSAILALQCASGACSLANTWSAAHVDEDFQIAHWGQDAEALARRAARWCEMEAAGQMIEAVCRP